MYPAVHTMTIIGIMSLAMVSLTGCAEKRVHVATLSGSPGERMESEADNQTTADDTQGLQGLAVDESNLGGKTSNTDLDLTKIPDPVPMAEPALTHSETPPTTMADSTSSNEGSGLPLQDGSSLNTQSSTSPQNAGSGNFGDLPQTAFSDVGSGNGENTASSFQDVSSQNPASQSDTSSSQMETAPPGIADPDLEQVPGNLHVAKAEPSDALQDQLERMKSEELAAVSAGLEDVFFQFDSWTLTGEGKQALERNMGWLQNDPSARLLIEGHADQRGTQAYNMILGKKRAGAIRDYLNELGVDQSRLSIISYGKDKPFCQDPTEVCHQLNRRGHLLVQTP
ncbi:MAG: OmpA family protein [Nitrospirales bacterium]|nr:OmpA family protein [Nitrospirales bacterium]